METRFHDQNRGGAGFTKLLNLEPVVRMVGIPAAAELRIFIVGLGLPWQHQRDLSVQVHTGKIIVTIFRSFDSISYEHHGTLEGFRFYGLDPPGAEIVT